MSQALYLPLPPLLLLTTPNHCFIHQALEKPDLVVHTGDIIDGDTHTASQGMEDLYGVSFGAGLPWAATIGNHDCQSDLSRPQLMDYILSLPKTGACCSLFRWLCVYVSHSLSRSHCATATERWRRRR